MLGNDEALYVSFIDDTAIYANAPERAGATKRKMMKKLLLDAFTAICPPTRARFLAVAREAAMLRHIFSPADLEGRKHDGRDASPSPPFHCRVYLPAAATRDDIATTITAHIFSPSTAAEMSRRPESLSPLSGKRSR